MVNTLYTFQAKGELDFVTKGTRIYLELTLPLLRGTAVNGHTLGICHIVFIIIILYCVKATS